MSVQTPIFTSSDILIIYEASYVYAYCTVCIPLCILQGTVLHVVHVHVCIGTCMYVKLHVQLYVM